MKRPLLPVTLLFVGGILLGDRVTAPLAALFSVSLGLAVWALFHSAARPWLLVPLLGMAGWTNQACRTAMLAPDDLRVLSPERTEPAVARGVLDETPAQNVFEHDGEMAWRTTAKLRVQAVQLGGGAWQSASGRLLVTTEGLLPRHFFCGQRVEVSGLLWPPRGARAEGLFDYRAYLRRQQIYHQLQVRSTNDWLLAHEGATRVKPPWSERFLNWAQASLARGLPVEDEPLRLQWAMVLGWKTALTNEVAAPFMRSGTIHIFAISGMHIVLITGILVALLRLVLMPREWCGWVIIPLIWFYTGATGWQASAIRSTLMMSVVIAGWSLRRPSDLVNSLFAAAFLILIWDPQQLFQTSFQLSFVVVLSLGLFIPPLEGLRQRLLKTDPFLPPELRPAWQRWLERPIYRVTTAIVASLAAWLGSLPVVAHYFHLFTPVSLLANMIIVPMSDAALMCGLGGLLTASWFPGVSELFNHSGWFWMKWMADLSKWAAALPVGWCYVPAPSPWAMAVYYAWLLAIMSGIFAWPKWRWGAVGALAALTVVWLLHWQHERPVARLTVLPLNRSHAVFVQPPAGGERWLLDCGEAEAEEYVVRPFLRAQGLNRLPNLVLTHGDIQHVGGASNLVRELAVQRVHVSSARFRSTAYRQAVSHFEQQTGLLHCFQRGQRIGPWEILHPEAAESLSLADDKATVLRGVFHGLRVLLLADLGRAGQDALLARQPDLGADIVIAGLPSQGEPLADALLDNIAPRLIIIADSQFPAQARASSELVERLGRRPLPVFYTRQTGAITLSLRPGEWEIRTMAEQRIVGQGR